MVKKIKLPRQLDSCGNYGDEINLSLGEFSKSIEKMVAAIIVIACLALLGGALYLRKTLPWPFTHDGQKYRRMPDATFQDANKVTITDPELIEKLKVAYEEAKYGKADLNYDVND
jgi:hypothetical protein